MPSKRSMKQMELWETAAGRSMNITGPVMQRTLSGEHVREERIYTLFDGIFVCYIYMKIENICIIYLYKIQRAKKLGKRIGCRQY